MTGLELSATNILSDLTTLDEKRVFDYRFLNDGDFFKQERFKDEVMSMRGRELVRNNLVPDPRFTSVVYGRDRLAPFRRFASKTERARWPSFPYIQLNNREKNHILTDFVVNGIEFAMYCGYIDERVTMMPNVAAKRAQIGFTFYERMFEKEFGQHVWFEGIMLLFWQLELVSDQTRTPIGRTRDMAEIKDPDAAAYLIAHLRNSRTKEMNLQMAQHIFGDSSDGLTAFLNTATPVDLDYGWLNDRIFSGPEGAITVRPSFTEAVTDASGFAVPHGYEFVIWGDIHYHGLDASNNDAAAYLGVAPVTTGVFYSHGVKGHSHMLFNARVPVTMAQLMHPTVNITSMYTISLLIIKTTMRLIIDFIWSGSPSHRAPRFIELQGAIRAAENVWPVAAQFETSFTRSMVDLCLEMAYDACVLAFEQPNSQTLPHFRRLMRFASLRPFGPEFADEYSADCYQFRSIPESAYVTKDGYAGMASVLIGMTKQTGWHIGRTTSSGLRTNAVLTMMNIARGRKLQTRIRAIGSLVFNMAYIDEINAENNGPEVLKMMIENSTPLAFYRTATHVPPIMELFFELEMMHGYCTRAFLRAILKHPRLAEVLIAI